ncbi:hypothetical protein P9112_013069 [Eukaryota sp. TZLM1-RC]
MAYYDIHLLIKDAENGSLIPLGLEDAVLQISMESDAIIVSDSGFTVYSLPFSALQCSTSPPLGLELVLNDAFYLARFLSEADFASFCSDLPFSVLPATTPSQPLPYLEESSICSDEHEPSFVFQTVLTPSFNLDDLKQGPGDLAPRPPLSLPSPGSLLSKIVYQDHDESLLNQQIKHYYATCQSLKENASHWAVVMSEFLSSNEVIREVQEAYEEMIGEGDVDQEVFNLENSYSRRLLDSELYLKRLLFS